MAQVQYSTFHRNKKLLDFKRSFWIQIFNQCESGMTHFNETLQFMLDEDLAFLKSESFQSYITQ